jgi:hypothetical protein
MRSRALTCLESIDSNPDYGYSYAVKQAPSFGRRSRMKCATKKAAKPKKKGKIYKKK